MAKKKSSATAATGDKSAAFAKLAEARVNKAIKAMRQIKYLTNPVTYTYTDDQVQLVLSALASAYNEVETAFKNPKAAKSEGFKLG